MPQQIIDVGAGPSPPNPASAETQYSANIKSNANFTELYGMAKTHAALNRLAVLGDSRVAQGFHVDPSAGSFANDTNATGFAAWAQALSLGRYRTVYNGGVAGDRTDQVLARVSAAITSGAGIVCLWCGVNDISQQYPTATTAGVTAYGNVRQMAETIRAAGQVPVIFLDTLVEGWSQDQIIQYFEMIERVQEYVESTPGVFLLDVAFLVMNPLAAGAAGFKPGYSADGTHINHRGAYVVGKALKALLDTFTPNVQQPSNRGALDVWAFNKQQMIDVGAFLQTTGGAANAGISGNVPAGWNAQRWDGSDAGAGATVTVEPDPDGDGNAMVLDIAFTSANDCFRVWTGVFGGNVTDRMAIGEFYRGELMVDVLGSSGNVNPTGLRGLELYLDFYSEPSENHRTAHVLNPALTSGDGIVEPCTLQLQTYPHQFQPGDTTPGSAGYWFAIYSSGAGNVKVKLRRARLRHLALGANAEAG